MCMFYVMDRQLSFSVGEFQDKNIHSSYAIWITLLCKWIIFIISCLEKAPLNTGQQSLFKMNVHKSKVLYFRLICIM